MKPGSALLTALLLAGTAGAAYGDVAAAITTYKSAPVCCSTLSAITFSPLGPGLKPISLGEKSPAFVFEPSGKSYFAAFALSAGNSLPVRVHSRIFQNPPQGMAIFFPRIMLLDQSKAIIATVNWSDDKILHPGEAGGPEYIETVADLSAYPSARFLIVYTDGDRIGAMETLQHVVTESSVTAPVTGVGYHVFFTEIPDPHLDPFLTTPVLRSPTAPDSLVIEVQSH